MIRTCSTAQDFLSTIATSLTSKLVVIPFLFLLLTLMSTEASSSVDIFECHYTTTDSVDIPIIDYTDIDLDDVCEAPPFTDTAEYHEVSSRYSARGYKTFVELRDVLVPDVEDVRHRRQLQRVLDFLLQFSASRVVYSEGRLLAKLSSANGQSTLDAVIIFVAGASTPVISIDPGPAIEEGGEASFALTAVPPPAVPLRVTVTVGQTGDFASSEGIGAHTVVVGTGGTGMLSVATHDDAIDEENGSITVAVADGEDYDVSPSSGSASVTVNDNDNQSMSVISISSTSTIDEGDFATFTLTADPPPTTSFEVSVTVTQTGDVVASEDTGSQTVTIGSDGTGTLTVRTITSNADDSAGSITVTVASGDDYTADGASASVIVRTVSESQTNDVSYIWECENNDHSTFAYDVGLECELSQSRRNMSVQEVVQSYLNDGYNNVRPDTPAREAEFNARYNVEGCSFLWKSISGDFEFSDVVVCPVPFREPVTAASDAQKNAVQGTVAAVAAATVSNVTSNIGTRFSAPTGGASVSLAGMPVVFGQSDSHASGLTSLADPLDALGEGPSQSRQMSLARDELLGSSSFEITLGAGEGSNGNAVDAGRRLTFWGRGDFQTFESGGGSKSGYDGDLVAGYLGVDFSTAGGWLTGLAISKISAEAEYTLGNAGGDGTLEARLTNFHPYVRFAVDDSSEAWAILGFGKGEVTDTAEGASRSTTDMSMKMLSAGARHLLNSFIGIDWALLGDGSLASVDTDEGVQSVDGISANVWRARLGMEASYTTTWESGASLTSFMELAARQDGGDTAEGVGLEISPGLALSDPLSGLGVEARGRALALHSADNHREYGASITVSKTSEADGTGLSLAMTPTWGAPTNSLDSIDASLFPQSAAEGRTDSLSLNSRVAYGFVAGPGVLAPFAEFSLHDSDRHRTRVGSRYSLGPSVDLELSGDRTSDSLGDPDHSVQFRARIGF